MKRIVKTLSLRNDPALIEEYCQVHDNIWPEIREGIKKSGISNMEIFLLGNLAVMIVEMPDGLDEDEAFSKLATFPRQQEWENYVSKFQDYESDSTSAQKWQTMKRVFKL